MHNDYTDMLEVFYGRMNQVDKVYATLFVNKTDTRVVWTEHSFAITLILIRACLLKETISSYISVWNTIRHVWQLVTGHAGRQIYAVCCDKPGPDIVHSTPDHTLYMKQNDPPLSHNVNDDLPLQYY